MHQHFIDTNGNYFVAIDPIETPNGATAVPARPASHWAWNGREWIEGAVPLPSREEQESCRRAAYVAEADPLFFMAQRGEATMEEWQAKIAEIKARFPYPAE